jgi:hypothetical protein
MALHRESRDRGFNARYILDPKVRSAVRMEEFLPANFSRLSRRAQSRVVLKLIPQMREALAQAQGHPGLCVEDPVGKRIDVLDGESERVLDQMETLALHVLGLPVPRRAA